jgi:hypothetical protein
MQVMEFDCRLHLPVKYKAMKTIFIYLLAGGMILSSCASHKKTIQGATTIASVAADGSCYDKAIFINEDHERPGIDAEYAWIRTRYPGYKLKGQSLNYSNNKPYDIIHITTGDGTAKDIYFDISNFYGKF